jgi:small-conductance mechanosensitive channel
MNIRNQVIFIVTLAAQLLLSAAAQAQDATDEEIVTQIAKSIRWGGVATSLFVIAGAWIAVRFFNNFIENLGDRFTARRMLFQKIGTIVQFFVYIGTIATVIALSIRIDNRVLALLGGTAAVAFGFAIRDLVASFIAGIMIMIDQPFQVGDRHRASLGANADAR